METITIKSNFLKTINFSDVLTPHNLPYATSILCVSKSRSGCHTVNEHIMNPKVSFIDNLYYAAIGYKKNALVTLSVMFESKSGKYILDVLTTKAGKIISIDNTIAKRLTVGDIRCSFTGTGNLIGEYWSENKDSVKTWADKAFPTLK